MALNRDRFTVAAGLAIEAARRRMVAANDLHGLARRSLSGPKGDTGPAGRDGINGKDGRHGLDGRDGVNGIDGTPGKDGATGAQGEAGLPGPQGPKGDAPDMKWRDGRLLIQSPDGSWGDAVNLRGPKGTGGASGGGGGSSGGRVFDFDSLPMATDAMPTEILGVRAGALAPVNSQALSVALSRIHDGGAAADL